MGLSSDQEEIFPADDVAASAADRKLQRANPIDALGPSERENLDVVRLDLADGQVSEGAQWIYFSSPDWTWSSECGREGWLLYDADSKTQYAFVMTVMS